ncbi:MAG: serine/threonine protein kinase [Nannocystaceae bacterium]|nr:serine/threonine protein kinase [Nannocystaceae bacterium]
MTWSMSVDPSKCPSTEVCVAYVEGGLRSPDVDRVEEHLAQCGTCCHVLMVFAQATATGCAAPTLRDEAVPTMPARYRLRGKVGRGGQGVVWRVWDQVLQREVAVKFVSTRSVRRRERLRREAQLLASVTHPTVLEVYDVDFGGDPGYICMPLCVGSLADPVLRPSSTRTIVEQFAAVAEGLAAVHAAGILHRDVKPSNLLVANDGSVRIADLGIATLTSETGDVGTRSQRAPVGTPGFLAPEVRRGAPHTPSSDQYSYFISLQEVLTCRRSSDLQASLGPAWIRSIVSRGLSDDPNLRFSDMHEVAESLRAGERKSRRRRLALGAVGMLGVLGAGATLSSRPPDDAVASPACAVQGPITWDSDTQLEIGIQLDNDARALSWMDAYVEGWAEAYDRSCEGAADAHPDSVRQCLWGQAERFDALVQRSRAGLSSDQRRALLRGLPLETAFEHCERMRDAAGQPLVPNPERPVVAHALLAVWAEATLGAADEQQEAVDVWLGDDRVDRYPDLRAELLLLRAGGTEDRAVKMAVLREAVEHARRGNAPTIEARAWREIATSQLAGNEPPEVAIEAISFADAALERAGNPAARRVEFEIVRLIAMSTTNLAPRDDLARDARENAKRAQALDSSATLAGALAVQAQLEALAGDPDDSLATATQASAAAAQAYGPMESARLRIDTLLGRRLAAVGRYDEAILLLEDLVERLEVADPHSMPLGVAWGDLATAQLGQGNAASAKLSAMRELAIYHRAGGLRLQALAEGRIGEAERELGNLEAAVEHLVRAQVLAESEVGTNHPLTMELRKKAAAASDAAAARGL